MSTRLIIGLLTALTLTACGGGGGSPGTGMSVGISSSASSSVSSTSSISSASSSSSSVSPPIMSVALNLAVPTAALQPKQLNLSWSVTSGNRNDVNTFRIALKASDASSYQVIQQVSNTQLGGVLGLPSLTALNWAQAKVQVQACDVGNHCVYSNEQSIVSVLPQTIGYIKASDTHVNDWFGCSVVISDDGNTLAVGTGSGDNDANRSAVYIFQKTGDTWLQQTILKAPITTTFSGFGLALSFSSDGNILVVGAPYQGSNAKGVGGDQANNLAPNSGAVYVFTRVGTSWSSTPVYVKASNTHADDGFGYSVAISGDGTTLAVGAPYENSAATGVDGDESDTSVLHAGAVYVYGISNGTVTKKNYLKATVAGADYFFGNSVALSRDGNMLVIGESGESTDGTPPPDNSLPKSGAVYVYPRSGGVWLRPGFIKAFNQGQGFYFGTSVALSADGGTMAVGSFGEASNATGVTNVSQVTSAAFDTSMPKAGAVYVYSINLSSGIVAKTYIKAPSHAITNAEFGSAVALSADGTVLAATVLNDFSHAIGVNGDQLDTSTRLAGAAYVFALSSGNWAQRAYVKSSNTGSNDQFGQCIAISSDGSTLAVGSIYEDSAATGIGGNQADNSAQDSGAVYLY